ncbi:MAG: hypothetical protein HY332_21165 [Chloroflexi bacterium]|nr:hypothetical protein [Chloroflexota bacterium]
MALASAIASAPRAPLVCHMPIVSLGLGRRGESGPLGTMALGLAFATGCMTCFGAALALGMVTYTVTTGSALVHAYAEGGGGGMDVVLFTATKTGTFVVQCPLSDRRPTLIAAMFLQRG